MSVAIKDINLIYDKLNDAVDALNGLRIKMCADIPKDEKDGRFLRIFELLDIAVKKLDEANEEVIGIQQKQPDYKMD